MTARIDRGREKDTEGPRPWLVGGLRTGGRGRFRTADICFVSSTDRPRGHRFSGSHTGADPCHRQQGYAVMRGRCRQPLPSSPDAPRGGTCPTSGALVAGLPVAAPHSGAQTASSTPSQRHPSGEPHQASPFAVYGPSCHSARRDLRWSTGRVSQLRRDAAGLPWPCSNTTPEAGRLLHVTQTFDSTNVMELAAPPNSRRRSIDAAGRDRANGQKVRAGGEEFRVRLRHAGRVHG